MTNQRAFSLPDYLNTIKENVASFEKSFPESFRAGVMLSDLFWNFYTRHLAFDRQVVWQEVADGLVFGCLASWTHAVVMSAAGLEEHSLTSTRRAIEFVCYTAKVANSDEKAELWKRRRESTDARKAFSRRFAIPKAFFSDKYAHLRLLLVQHDHASDFGAQANLATFASKLREEEKTYTFSLFDHARDIPLNASTTIEIGSLLLLSLIIDLKQIIRGVTELKQQCALVEEQLKASRLEIGKFETAEGIEPEILQMLGSGAAIMQAKYDRLKQDYTS
jgi:hypothetical protein